MNNDVQITKHDFLIYKDGNNNVHVNVMLINNDLWLTQSLIAELFGTTSRNIGLHIKNIYEQEELTPDSTRKEIFLVQKEGNRNIKRKVKIYNLDVIIAVGYRVNSKKATQFRIWATKVLKEYMIKGFAMDDERLKNPNYIFGEDYFEELLSRIRNIRASERRFYQKITDIYATSIDYDKNCDTTKEFFKTVQNKLHYSITGQTAAEIVYNRVDSNKEHLGLTNWKNSPNEPIYKDEVTIAKNYLTEEEIDKLNRIVTMYLDYAELQAKEHNAMTMNDWIDKLNAFLKFNGKDVLNDKGKISHEIAKKLAEDEYDKYRKAKDKLYKSDYDKFIEIEEHH